LDAKPQNNIFLPALISFLYKNLTKIAVNRDNNVTDSDAEMDRIVGRAFKDRNY